MSEERRVKSEKRREKVTRLRRGFFIKTGYGRRSERRRFFLLSETDFLDRDPSAWYDY